MFGLSREDRRRVEQVEEVAQAARDRAGEALSKIATHVGECSVREANREKWQNDVDGTLRWVNRQGLLLLLMTLGAILLGIAEHKGLF